MFQTIKHAVLANKKRTALVLTFALVISGSGLSSLASLTSTLSDSVTFNTLSVTLTDGGSSSAAVTFSGLNPSVDSSREQDLNLTNSGSASATITVASSVTTGAGSDLDSAITVLVNDGTCASNGPRINGTGLWPSIAATGASIPAFGLNAGASRPICLHFSIAANPAVTPSVVASFQFTAVHP